MKSDVKNTVGGDKMGIPNILTTGRILLIPIVIYCFVIGAVQVAGAIFVFACITDILDGFIARRYNMVTEVGKLLDPAADKGMSLAVLICMATYKLMPWCVVLIILVKEIMMFLGGIILYRNRVSFSANWYGKAATIITSVCVLIILFFHGNLPEPLLRLLQWMPVAGALFALLMYSLVYRSIKPGKTANL